jgi:hypothetical protein
LFDDILSIAGEEIVVVVVVGSRVIGPMESYAAGFAAELNRLGYTPLSVAGQMRLAAH